MGRDVDQLNRAPLHKTERVERSVTRAVTYAGVTVAVQ